jgi:hypothetical protein
MTLHDVFLHLQELCDMVSSRAHMKVHTQVVIRKVFQKVSGSVWGLEGGNNKEASKGHLIKQIATWVNWSIIHFGEFQALA